MKTPGMAIARGKGRVGAGGHNIPEDVVRRRYKMGLKYFFKTYIPVCDQWILADNSRSPFTIVAEGVGKLTYIKDNKKYRSIVKIAEDED